LINPTHESEPASLMPASGWVVTDLFDRTRYSSRKDELVVPVPARSVRMLAIDLA
jgi:hypothetical protein